MCCLFNGLIIFFRHSAWSRHLWSCFSKTSLFFDILMRLILFWLYKYFGSHGRVVASTLSCRLGDMTRAWVPFCIKVELKKNILKVDLCSHNKLGTRKDILGRWRWPLCYWPHHPKECWFVFKNMVAITICLRCGKGPFFILLFVAELSTVILCLPQLLLPRIFQH